MGTSLALFSLKSIQCCYSANLYLIVVLWLFSLQEADRSKRGKSKHSQWRNYDDINEYFWYKHIIFSFSSLVFFCGFSILIPVMYCRSVDCFRLGWPMRADADFFCMPSEQRYLDKSSEVSNTLFI